eukprot:g27472.t1
MAEEQNTLYQFSQWRTPAEYQNIKSARGQSIVAITKENVLGKLKGLHLDKPPGPDGPQPRVLKEKTEEIVKALVVNFQESLESGRVPEDRNVANASSLFKKGGRQKTGNYRPVSLTSVIGKILESVVEDEIAEYLEVHDFSGEVMSKLNKGEPVDVIYLDFQKAFDKVLQRGLQ